MDGYVKPDGDYYLTPGEVAQIFRVDPKTVTRWAKSGKLPGTRTPGGHGRFRASDVNLLLRNGTRQGQERGSA